jgi:hypothetical protein
MNFEYASTMIWRVNKDGARSSGMREYDIVGGVVEAIAEYYSRYSSKGDPSGSDEPGDTSDRAGVVAAS